MVSTYVISPSGNDATGTGSSANPWASVEKFWASAVAADIMEARGGTYSEANSRFSTVSGANRVRNNVIMQNYAGETPRFIWSGTPATQRHMWRIESQVGTIIRSNPAGGQLQSQWTGTPVTDFPSSQKADWGGIYLLNGSAHVIDGLRSVDTLGCGVYMEATTDSNVRNSEITGGSNGLRAYGCTRPVFEDNHIHGVNRMFQNDASPTTNDNGANAISIVFGTNGSRIRRNRLHDCWSVIGSIDYGMDGGAIETYACDSVLQHIIEDNFCYDNHGFLETGTQDAWTNGNFWVRRNQVYGRNDFQPEGIGSGVPSTPFMLIRAFPDSLIEHNTWDVEDGSTTSGGIRIVSGGGFAGALNNITLRSNAGRMRINVQFINANGVTSWPASFLSDYNHVFRTTHAFGSGANVVALNSGGSTYAYSATGLTNWKATPQGGANELWGTDPLFVDPNNADRTLRDYTPGVGSPLIGAAHDGTDIGAVQHVTAPIYASASDNFGRVGSTWGTATTGGVWTEDLAGASDFTTDGTSGLSVISAATTMACNSLLQVSMLDVYAYGEFQFDKVPAGDIIEAFLTVRGSNLSPLLGGYAGHVIIHPTTVDLNFNRIDLVTGARTGIPGGGVTIAREGVPLLNTIYAVRLYCTGTSPTTLQAKVWKKDLEAEPGSMDASTTDSTAGYQVAGSVGVRDRIDSGTTNPPITFRWDNLLFSPTPPASPPPAPQPTRRWGRRYVLP